MFTDGKKFSARVKCDRFNHRYGDKKANPGASKYKQTPVPLLDGSRPIIKVHNIEWCMTHGYWPPDSIDHINGNSLDNHPTNHRLASDSQQAINKIHQSGSSGIIGISRYKNGWFARLMKDGVMVLNKFFVRKRDAIAARRAAELKYHGEYRRRRIPP